MIGGRRNTWTALLILSIFLCQSECAIAFNIVDNKSGGISNDAVLSRRQFALHVPAAASAAAFILTGCSASAGAATLPASPIASRFETDVLASPPITAGTRNTGHENLYFPSWLEGEWEVTQTLVSSKAPLGLKFVGGPQGSLDVAQKSMDEFTKRLNEPGEIYQV